LIPPIFLDCVTSIGIIGQDKSKKWIGTGFLVGRFFTAKDEGKKEYHVFLVTNKHVIDNFKSIIIRFNPDPSAGGAALDYPIELQEVDGKSRWIGHPREDIDIAVININAPILRKHARKFAYFRSDEDILRTKEMVDKGVS
jgi:hypothetical protein